MDYHFPESPSPPAPTPRTMSVTLAPASHNQEKTLLLLSFANYCTAVFSQSPLESSEATSLTSERLGKENRSAEAMEGTEEESGE